MKFCGIDLHSNNSVVVVSDAEDRIVLQRRVPTELGAILAALVPHCEDLAGVVVESTYNWYVAYPLSLRHLEGMMAERGISVDHSSVHRWAIKVLPVLEKTFRHHKKAVGRNWRMDESVSRTQAKACDAVLKMGVGLPKSACRGRLQTARCCCVQKAWW